MALGNNVLVGQSGGPTAAINASLAGVVGAARAAGLHTVGMRYGIQGLLDGTYRES
jgi:6-phosphofructokinase 1